MPTIQEVLKQTGLSDEQIAALDQKVVQGLEQYTTTALQQAQEVEANARKSVTSYINNELNPALTAWSNEKASLAAENAALKAALEAAKNGGFVPPDINIGSPISDPNAGQPRDPQTGKFVAGANPVPGSPGFNVNEFKQGVGAVIGTMSDLQWKYQTLFGQPMPDAPSQIIREASEQGLNPIQYAAKKYGFEAKEKEIVTKRQQEAEDRIRKDAIAERDKYWSERQANPMLRPAESSSFSTINKAVAAGKVPDPLVHRNREERHRATMELIGKEIAENQSAG